MTKEKLLAKIRNNQKNIKFREFVLLIESFGFSYVRTNGSHTIYAHPRVVELVNIQNVNGQAKPYQIKGFLNLVDAYHLSQEVTND